ncbi:WbqC family protein [Megalodesulfovibrio paquesii]
MRTAIMQPYFFPYLGYFNLIHACDSFVFLDNVQHIDRGFVNRNRILVQGKPHLFTVPLAAAPREAWIQERFLSESFPQFRAKFLTMLKHAYAKAPNYAEVMELVADVLASETLTLAQLCQKSILATARYLGLERRFLVASDMLTAEDARRLKGAEKILALAKALGTTRYLNPIGGIELYHEEVFAREGMELRFVKPALPAYPQPAATFVPALSILDVMMQTPQGELAAQLAAYVLIDGTERPPDTKDAVA